MKHPLHLVLVGGAGLGGWIWNKVVQELGDASVFEPDPEADLATRAHALEAWIRQLSRTPVLIVAHSAGALPVLELTGSHPELVAGVVFLGSILPRRGRSFVASLPFPQTWVLPLLLRAVGTVPPENVILSSLSTGLGEVDRQRILTEYRREAPGLFLDRLRNPQWPSRRLYILLTDDQAVDLALQNRQCRGWKPEEKQSFAAGHLPMLSHPRELSALLARFRQGLQSGS